MQIVALALAAALSSPITQDADLRMVDYVKVIVNDEILTYRQVMGATVRKIPEGVQLTPQQLAALHNNVAIDLIQERLKMQGGIDMGIESQAVERLVGDNMERQIDAAGGAIQMADRLGQRELSLNDQKTAMRRKLYRFSWERAITGVGAGVSGRAYRDRYVRPGKLRLHHEQLKDGLLGAEAIGGTPALFSLQQLVFPISSGDIAEQVRIQAEKTYSELSAGADFTEIIRAQSTPAEKDGMLSPKTWLQLAKNGGPKVALFAQSAAIGELSSPIPILSEGQLIGWRIIKLIKAEQPVLPIFNLPQTQSALRTAIQNETDEHRRRAGIKALRLGAYIWPNEEDLNT
jgi:hypothetical protein